MDTVIDLPRAENSRGLNGVLRLCARALTEPARFFRHDFPQLSLTEALTFGIANGWAAAVLAFFVQTLNSFLLSRLLERWMQRIVASEEGFRVWGISSDSFLFTSGLLVLAPFLLLLRTCLMGFGLYIFARLLVEDRPSAPEPVTFPAALRIEAITLSAHWYSLVPIFGGVLSFIVGLVLRVTGVRERFGVSNRRAVAVVFAPYALFALALMLVVAFVLVALTQVPFQDLLDLDSSSFGA